MWGRCAVGEVNPGLGLHLRIDLDGNGLLAFIIDVFARKIVGWRVSTSMTASFVLDVLNQAICQRCPTEADKLIHPSDRGSQYLSIHYRVAVGLGRDRHIGRQHRRQP